MKNVMNTAMVTLLVFSTVVYTACKKKTTDNVSADPCKGIVCQHNGYCIDGTCNCTKGYTGDYCQDKTIKPYLGKWNVEQKITASENQGSVGQQKSYQMVISEDASGVTVLNIKGFYGESSATILGRIGTKIDNVEINGVITETEVPAGIASFTLNRNQAITNTLVQVVKGQGSINSLGTQMSCDFQVTYPDSAKGAINEWVSFTASHVD